MLVYLLCPKEKHGPRTYFEMRKYGKQNQPFHLKYTSRIKHAGLRVSRRQWMS